MAVEVKLPQFSMSMTEGTIEEWKKSVGDDVEKGEALCSVGASKMETDLESPVSGKLLKICVEEGDTVSALTVVCIIGEEGETV